MKREMFYTTRCKIWAKSFAAAVRLAARKYKEGEIFAVGGDKVSTRRFMVKKDSPWGFVPKW